MDTLKKVVSPVAAPVAAAAAALVHEDHSEAHRLFREQPGHRAASKKGAQPHVVPGIEHPGSVGVVYVSERAAANGYYPGNKEWANFGQGAPETGQIPGAAPKPTQLELADFGDDIHEYGPTAGIPALRQKIADYYNVTFRKGMKPFEAENICVVPGGRAGLSRLMSVISPIMLGYQVPDYAAYEPLLGSFGKVQSIPLQLSEKNKFKLTVEQLRQEIHDRGLTAVLLSNPRNPCGTLIEGEELRQLVELSLKSDTTMIVDEFYAWYLHEGPVGRAVSAAQYIEDPNECNLALIDGLTKGWRCPGWRVAWVAGSKDLISAISQAGSYLDGGASHPMQVLALQMLDPQRVVQDREALQKHFRMKREYMLKRLERMGLPVTVPPVATFYIWLNLSNLPKPLNSGLVFAEECLREKVIVTPGIVFDVNPSHRRNIVDSASEPFVRISYGPTIEECERGCDAFERVLAKARKGEKLGEGYTRAATELKEKHNPPAHG